MRISFNKSTIMYIIMFIVSVILTIYGATGLYHTNEMLSIGDLETSSVTKGQFVDLTGMQAIPYTYVNKEDGTPPSNVLSSTFLGYKTEYDYVMTNLSDGSAIYVLLKNNDDDGSSLAYKNTSGVTGMITKSPVEIPEGILYNTASSGVNVSEFVIKEINVHNRNVTLFPGVFFLLLSVILFFRDQPY